jgi:hypothetical protein
MTELEKIGLDHILQLVIDAEMHFYNSNKTDSTDDQKDTERGYAEDNIGSAIDLLTRAINNKVSNEI